VSDSARQEGAKAKYLPIFLDVSQKRVLLVGGGTVAAEKVRGLKPFVSDITIIAKTIHPDISDVTTIIGEYSKKVLDGFDLIYACTSDRELNRRIRDDAHEHHLIVNVVDDPSLSDFISPAVFCSDPMTIAVSSGGKDVKRTVALRDQIREWMTSHD